MAKSDFCIIGLGRFGMQVAKSLTNNGYNVILIDVDDEKIELAAKEFQYVIRADSTNLNSLVELGINDISTVIVGVSNIEASIMICANLKELKIKNIIARAKNTIHKRVLNTMGVREAVIPEEIVGENVALKVTHGLNADIFTLGNKEISLVRVSVTNPELFNKKLVDLNVRDYAGANIISIQRQGQLIFPIIATTILKQADIVSAVCKSQDIDVFLNYINFKNN